MKHALRKGRIVIGLVPDCLCGAFPDEGALSPIELDWAGCDRVVGRDFSLMVTYQVTANCPICGRAWDIRTVDAI